MSGWRCYKNDSEKPSLVHLSCLCGLFLLASLNAETGMLGTNGFGRIMFQRGVLIARYAKEDLDGKAHDLGHRPDVRGLGMLRLRMVVPDSRAFNGSSGEGCL